MSSNKPIYLTTARLLYNMARVDYRNGRVSEDELKRYKENWETEYNHPRYLEINKKKYDSKL